MNKNVYRVLTALLIIILAAGFINNYSPATISSGDDSTNNSRSITDNNSFTSISTDISGNSSSVRLTNTSIGKTGKRLNALWKEIGNEVFIQIQNAMPTDEMLYGEITLESGSRIAVILGKPNEEGKFSIKNTFGKFSNISIYTDSDLK